MFHYVYSQVAILCYSGTALGSKTPPLFGWQTRNLSTINQQWSLWMYTKYLVDVSKFLKYETFNFWEVLIFAPLWGGVIINSEYQGRRDLPRVPKFFCYILPGYENFCQLFTGLSILFNKPLKVWGTKTCIYLRTDTNMYMYIIYI